MASRIHRLVFLTVLTAWLGITQGSALAQSPPSSSGAVILGSPLPAGPGSAPIAPVPLAPSEPPPPPPPAPMIPGSPLAPLPPAPSPFQLTPPPPPASSPIFLPPGQTPSGAFLVDGHVFTSVQVDAVYPYVSNRLQGYVPLVNGQTIFLTVPSEKLSWTISPRFDIGLRIPGNGSEVGLGYRFLVTEGTGTISTIDGPMTLKSRLDINQFDTYYGSCLNELAPCLNLRWRAGIRTAIVFYDTQASNAVLNQHISNYFVGAGPEAGIELIQQLSFLPSFSLFARADGAILVGQIQQNYTQQVPFVAMNPLNGGVELKATQSVPVGTVQAGLNFVPPGTGLRFTLGYALEQWWSLGHVETARLDLTMQSVFLRGELDF